MYKNMVYALIMVSTMQGMDKDWQEINTTSSLTRTIFCDDTIIKVMMTEKVQQQIQNPHLKHVKLYYSMFLDDHIKELAALSKKHIDMSNLIEEQSLRYGELTIRDCVDLSFLFSIEYPLRTISKQLPNYVRKGVISGTYSMGSKSLSCVDVMLKVEQD